MTPSCPRHPFVLGAVLVSAFTLVGAGIAAQQNPPEPEFPDGLARALESIGQSILGSGGFFAVKQNPPEPDKPSLNLWVTQTPDVPTYVNIYSQSPPDPDHPTWLRISIHDGIVTVHQDVFGNPNTIVPDYSADLSSFVPPSPVSRR